MSIIYITQHITIYLHTLKFTLVYNRK